MQNQRVTINGIQQVVPASGIVTQKVPYNRSYSVSLNARNRYSTPANQSFTANSLSRSVTMTYKLIPLGIFIEATDGSLYTSSEWNSGLGKTANAIAILTSNVKFRLAITDLKEIWIHSNYTDPLINYLPAVGDYSTDQTPALNDFAGLSNTNKIIQFNQAYGTNTTSYAAPYSKAYTFPNGQKNGYLPAEGQLRLISDNLVEIKNCVNKVGIYTMFNGSGGYYSSTGAKPTRAVPDPGYDWYSVWGYYFHTGNNGSVTQCLLGGNDIGRMYILIISNY